MTKRCDGIDHWDAEDYQKGAGYVAQYGESLLELLNVREGMRVLDLGCGDGKLTEQIGQLGAQVVGVDASESMVSVARGRGLDAEVVSGESLHFKEDFDAVFSNAALHWMKDAPGVIDGVYRSLKEGGQFIGEMGGAGNIQGLREAMAAGFKKLELGEYEDPWYFPDEIAYRSLLEASGFEVLMIERFERPTQLPEGVLGWLEVFAQGIVSKLNDLQREALFDFVEDRLAKTYFDKEQDSCYADYVRLRFVARKSN